MSSKYTILNLNVQNYFIINYFKYKNINVYPSTSRFLKILGLGEIIGLNTCWLLGIVIHGSSLYPDIGPIKTNQTISKI